MRAGGKAGSEREQGNERSGNQGSEIWARLRRVLFVFRNWAGGLRMSGMNPRPTGRALIHDERQMRVLRLALAHEMRQSSLRMTSYFCCSG